MLFVLYSGAFIKRFFLGLIIASAARVTDVHSDEGPGDSAYTHGHAYVHRTKCFQFHIYGRRGISAHQKDT